MKTEEMEVDEPTAASVTALTPAPSSTVTVSKKKEKKASAGGP
jgi:hypothetical protein